MNPLKKMLIRHEGLRLKPYRDTVGKLTIGVGRNLDDVGISEEEAMILLETDIMRATYFAMQAIPGFLVLNSARQDVIISMIFNLGPAGFLKFRLMIKAIKDGDYPLAAREMLNSRWATQVGKRAHELAEMMLDGKYVS